MSLTLQDIYIIISSIIVFAAYLIYEWSIITGRTRPHRTTRLVLFIITVLGTASLFAQHDTVAIWLIGICALQSAVVLLLSFKYGVGGWAKTDLVCLMIALFGIVIWKLTNNPVLALYAAITADFAGMVPALIKTYRFPHTEFWLAYAFDITAASFSLLAIQKWDIQGFSYPLYIFIINIIMLLIIVIRPRFITSQNQGN